MAKLKEKVSIEEILIDEIENSSTNDWDELCNIVKKVKNGTI